MQPPRAEQGLDYASLNWRFVAVAIDMTIVFFILVAVLMVTVAAGWLKLPDYTVAQAFTAKQDVPGWLYPISYGVVFLYFTLFELRSASPGKIICRMAVLHDDGTPPTASAIVVRNLVRLPELFLYYIPSGISCLVSGQNKRLGDLAAHTVVVRRSAAPSTPWTAGDAPFGGGAPFGGAPPTPSARVMPPSPATTWPAAGGDDVPWNVDPPAPAAAVGSLKTAALALAGAHHAYLRHSAVELAAAEARPDTAPGEVQPEPPATYAPEYVAAWFTLTEAVAAYRGAEATAGSSAAAAGMSLSEAVADRPDLSALMDTLRPYLDADSEAEIHDAYLSVARAELPTDDPA